MVPQTVTHIDTAVSEDGMYAAVQELSVADIEELSISDISSLNNRALKDLLNHEVSNRLTYHMGGTYTSPPKASLAEFNA